MIMSEKLNYTLTSVEERLELVNDILKKHEDELVDYYSNNFKVNLKSTDTLSENKLISKNLEKMADYLLSAEDELVDIEVINDYRRKRNTSRETPIDLDVHKVKRETYKSIYRIQKIKVTDKDRKIFKELSETHKTINMISKTIQENKDQSGDNLKYIRRLKWIRTDIQKDEVAIKSELMSYIKFYKSKYTASHIPDASYLQYIRFDDIETVRVLIEHYADLKELSYDDTFGYMKLMIMSIEELIDSTIFEPYLKDVLMWKIDKRSYDFMISELVDKYDKKISKPSLSKLTRLTIPSMICDTYKQSREDWVYTYMLYGNYQKCNICKKNLLKMSKNFAPSNISKTGFRKVCKLCMKTKEKERIVKKV